MNEDVRIATIARIVTFLESISLEVRTGIIEDKTFVPGVGHVAARIIDSC